MCLCWTGARLHYLTPSSQFDSEKENDHRQTQRQHICFSAGGAAFRRLEPSQILIRQQTLKDKRVGPAVTDNRTRLRLIGSHSFSASLRLVSDFLLTQLVTIREATVKADNNDCSCQAAASSGCSRYNSSKGGREVKKYKERHVFSQTPGTFSQFFLSSRSVLMERSGGM